MDSLQQVAKRHFLITAFALTAIGVVCLPSFARADEPTLADPNQDFFRVPSVHKFVHVSRKLRLLNEEPDDAARTLVADDQPLNDPAVALQQDDDDPENDSASSISDPRLTRMEGGRFVLPPLAARSIATDEIGNGRLPEGFRGAESSPIEQLAESGEQRNLDPQPWHWSVAHWNAANTNSFPRYFEDRMLERHGQERFPKLQPLTSGVRFFATVPMLPYLMTLSDPRDCESTLGYYRSGSCVPTMRQRPPLSRRAVIAEAAAVTGVIAVFP